MSDSDLLHFLKKLGNIRNFCEISTTLFWSLKGPFYIRWASLVSGARLLRHMLYEPYVRKQADPLTEISALAAGVFASRASPLSHIDIGNVKRKIRHEPSQAVKGRVRLTGVAPFIYAGPYLITLYAYQIPVSILGKCKHPIQIMICPWGRVFVRRPVTL